MDFINPKVDEFINKIDKWSEEIKLLRKFILECGLVEELKWKHPCYTYKNNNIVIINNFKECCCIGFFKGALLNDSHHVLDKPGENTQSGKLFKFHNIQEIKEKETILKNYIFEAIKIEKAGLKINYKKTEEYPIPEELQQKLDQNHDFKKAFEALTPGRQRGYLLHFSSAKNSTTRISRIENCASRIFKGKGLMDCICGQSKRLPNCDGSHKFLAKEK